MSEPVSSKGRVTSVDVWDTLIRRRCHPDEVKLAAARFVRLSNIAWIKPDCQSELIILQERRAAEVAIGNRHLSEGHDDEYGLVEVWRRALERVFVSTPEATLRGAVEAVVRFELAFEERVTYPDPGIAALLSREGVTSLHLLSDFYVSGEELLALVRRRHPDLDIVGAMVSCDERVTKRSGRLYRRFQRARGIQPEQHFHIGDNPESDVASALKVGVTALRYEHPEEERKRRQFNVEYQARLKGDVSAYIRALREQILEAVSKDPRADDKRFRFGAEQAPLYVLYVLFALEQAIEQRAERVYYFTREGEVLAKIHAAIAAALPHQKLPTAELLEVSRLATFGASIREFGLRELGRFWTMYPRHSLNTLLTSLGLKPADYASMLWDLGFDPELPITRPWENQRFLKLLANAAFKAQVERDLSARRNDLLAYLAERGLTESTERVVVVEIGWRGTIQDNLARVLPGTKWHGVYLALFRYLNSQPDNTSKVAFLFNDNLGEEGEKVLSPQAPLEMLFNSPSGSVTGYGREAGKMVAQRTSAQGEDRIFHSFTGVVQDGVLAAVPAMVQWMEHRALGPTDLRSFARKCASLLLVEPPRLFARAYFDLEHNETFGVGGFVRKEKGLLRDLWKAGSLEKAWRVLGERPRTSGWAAGYYAAHASTDSAALLVRYAGARGDMKRIPKLIGRVSREVWNGTQKRGLAPVLADIRDALAAPSAPVAEGIRMIPLVQTAPLEDDRLLHFNERMREARAKAGGPFVVAWLIPDIGLGSGGHMTLLRFVRYFRSLGIINKVYIHGRSRHRDRTALEKFVRANYGPDEGIEFYPSSELIDDSDVLIATHWTTAYEVFRRENTRFKAYFIQDFEPHFYAKGSLGVFAENTYRMNLFGICASPWLYQVARSYGMNANAFHLGYEPETYYQDPLVERDRNRLVVYLRPTTERRGTELLLATLLIVKKARPQTRISIFGTSKIPDVGLKAEIMGLLNEEQLRRLHSSSAITLLTSMTNYSLMPIEAMACGSVVVDVDVESTRATFEEDAPIRLVHPDSMALAREILGLLDNRERLDELSAQSITYAQRFQWSRAFEEVSAALFGAAIEGLQGVPATREGLVRARGGTQVFRVQGGRKVAVDEAKVIGNVTDLEVRSLLATPYD